MVPLPPPPTPKVPRPYLRPSPPFSPHSPQSRMMRMPCAQRVMACCGDTHPHHPRLPRIAVAYVTLMRAHLDTVLAWEVDMLLLPGTRHPATAHCIQADMVRDAGLQAFWGVLLEPQGPSIW